MHFGRSALNAAILAATILTPALALADNVTIAGCPEPGVQAGCVLITVKDGVYDVSAAMPTPLVGVPQQVVGTIVANGPASACGATNVISSGTTSPAAQIACPDRWLG
jgi:hypothetical protein